MSTSAHDKITKSSPSDKGLSSPPSVNSDDDSKVADSVIEDIEHLPSDKKHLVEKLMIQEFGMMGVSHISQENEVAKKINESHITNYLDGAREQMQNDYKERHERKIYTGILVFLALAFFVTIIVLLKDNPDILEKIIYSVGGLIAGAFGGYGFGKHKSQDDD